MVLERSVAEGRKCLPEERERENDATEIILYVFFFSSTPMVKTKETRFRLKQYILFK